MSICETDKRPHVCILSGSPRRSGVSAYLAQVAAQGVLQADVSADVCLLADHDIPGCTGCGYCERTGNCVLSLAEAKAVPDTDQASDTDRPAQPSHKNRASDTDQVTDSLHKKPLHFDDLYQIMSHAQALILVAPVYFAGPSSQLKAFLDRLQFLWSRRYLLKQNPVVTPRKPCALVVTGGGGDPFGYDPLEQCVRSSLRMANFELSSTLDCVGWQPDFLKKGDADNSRLHVVEPEVDTITDRIIERHVRNLGYEVACRLTSHDA